MGAFAFTLRQPFAATEGCGTEDASESAKESEGGRFGDDPNNLRIVASQKERPRAVDAARPVVMGIGTGERDYSAGACQGC